VKILFYSVEACQRFWQQPLWSYFDEAHYATPKETGTDLSFFDDYTIVVSARIADLILPKRYRLVQTFHSYAGKTAEYNPFFFRKPDGSDLFALHLCMGPLQQKILEQMGLSNIAPVGFPRWDLLQECNLELLKEALFEEPDKPLYTYAPTWVNPHSDWQFSSLYTFYSHVTRAIPDDVNFLFIPHQLMYRYDDTQEFLKGLRSRGVTTPPPGADPLPFLAISDLLIGDFSGIMIEWLLFQRPMLFLNDLAMHPARLLYYRLQSPEVQVLTTGPVITDPCDIHEELRQVEENTETYQEQRALWRDRCWYPNLEGSAQRAADAIRRLDES